VDLDLGALCAAFGCTFLLGLSLMNLLDSKRDE
jgi:hypothetical protein